jgi:SPP1 gp7 family putative phage head morphogenesis protein
MNNGEYWQKRFELLEQAAHQQGVQCYADIEKQYRQAQKQLEGQIAAWYQRFASNNGVTLAEAKRMLNAKELAELKWDVNQYIQYGQENAISGTWVKQLENASARFHISRLEALKLQTQQSIEVMFENQLDSIDSTMRNVYKSGYYHTAYEIQKGVGVGWDFSALDDKQISKVINKPWAVDGKNFSERIWGNHQKLVNELNNTLTQNIILGKDPQKAIDEIARKMNTSKVNAGRLVMTEEAFFSSAAQKDCFAELDVEMYEIVATLDSHTSDICRGMDGKHFKMSEWKVGETAPPFHVHCRSTTVPYFDDEFDAVGERAARDEETGKTYFVPGNITYKEWEKSFVNGGDKSDLQPVNSDDTIKEKEPSEAFQQIQKACEADKVEYRPVQKLSQPLSSDKIIERLAGGDMTNGSCSSLAFAYIGNRNGLDVLDFRGGGSQYVFSMNSNIKKILELPGVNGSITMVKKEISGTMEVLNNLVLNKEYYLATGKHAAIVRRVDSGVEYLELQSKFQNGWMPFDRYGSMAATLNKRFGCRKTVDKQFGKVWEKSVVLMDVESFNENTEFEQILGYINTAVESQKKGVTGDVK